MRLTDHFTLEEMIASETAARLNIANYPQPNQIGNLLMVAHGLERVRSIVMRPIQILSGYRSKELNAAIGGARNSQHVLGLAADIRVAGMSARKLAEILAGNPASLGIDQLILEHPESLAGSWVHLGFAKPPRGEVLTGAGHPTMYTKGLPA